MADRDRLGPHPDPVTDLLHRLPDRPTRGDGSGVSDAGDPRHFDPLEPVAPFPRAPLRLRSENREMDRIAGLVGGFDTGGVGSVRRFYGSASPRPLERLTEAERTGTPGGIGLLGHHFPPGHHFHAKENEAAWMASRAATQFTVEYPGRPAGLPLPDSATMPMRTRADMRAAGLRGLPIDPQDWTPEHVRTIEAALRTPEGIAQVRETFGVPGVEPRPSVSPVSPLVDEQRAHLARMLDRPMPWMGPQDRKFGPGQGDHPWDWLFYPKGLEPDDGKRWPGFERPAPDHARALRVSRERLAGLEATEAGGYRVVPGTLPRTYRAALDYDPDALLRHNVDLEGQPVGVHDALRRLGLGPTPWQTQVDPRTGEIWRGWEPGPGREPIDPYYRLLGRNLGSYDDMHVLSRTPPERMRAAIDETREQLAGVGIPGLRYPWHPRGDTPHTVDLLFDEAPVLTFELHRTLKRAAGGRIDMAAGGVVG